MENSYKKRFPGIADSGEGIYNLKYKKERFSDEAIAKFMEGLERLKSMAGERIVIHGISSTGLHFAHHGELLPYQNTAKIDTSDPNDYGYVTTDIKFTPYTEKTEELEFNHLVETTNTIFDGISILDGRTSTYISKFLFSPFFYDMDPSCLYILDICDEKTGEKILENINNESLLKSATQVEDSKKQYGLNIEGSFLDPVSQKVYENIGNFVILNGQLQIVSSLKMNEDGTPCAILGNKNEFEVTINENSEIIIASPNSNEQHSYDFVWNEVTANNPEKFLKALSERTKYIQQCLTSGQPAQD